jgi:hypothetical protein
MASNTKSVLFKPVCPVCRYPCKDGSEKRDHLQEYHPEVL